MLSIWTLGYLSFRFVFNLDLVIFLLCEAESLEPFETNDDALPLLSAFITVFRLAALFDFELGEVKLGSTEPFWILPVFLAILRLYLSINILFKIIEEDFLLMFSDLLLKCFVLMSISVLINYCFIINSKS